MESVVYYTGIGSGLLTNGMFFFTHDGFREICINELGLSSNLTLEEMIGETGAILVTHEFMNNICDSDSD